MDSYRQRPSNFFLVRSEHAHASYPGLFFLPARVQPLYGAGRKESTGTGLNITLINLDKLNAFVKEQVTNFNQKRAEKPFQKEVQNLS